MVAVREAIHGGFRRVLTASSGNAGAALAAYAARAGVEAAVVVDPVAPPEKLRQIRDGADIHTVEGLFNQPSETFIEQLTQMARERDAYLAFFWEPVNRAIIQAAVTRDALVGRTKNSGA